MRKKNNNKKVEEHPDLANCNLTLIKTSKNFLGTCPSQKLYPLPTKWFPTDQRMLKIFFFLPVNFSSTVSKSTSILITN